MQHNTHSLQHPRLPVRHLLQGPLRLRLRRQVRRGRVHRLLPQQHHPRLRRYALSLSSTPDRNSDVHFLDFKGHAMSKQVRSLLLSHAQTVHAPSLPFSRLLFLSNTVLAAGGFDGNLYILHRKEEQWWRRGRFVMCRQYRGVVDVSAAPSTTMSSSFQERIRVAEWSEMDRRCCNRTPTRAA